MSKPVDYCSKHDRPMEFEPGSQTYSCEVCREESMVMEDYEPVYLASKQPPQPTPDAKEVKVKRSKVYLKDNDLPPYKSLYSWWIDYEDGSMARGADYFTEAEAQQSYDNFVNRHAPDVRPALIALLEHAWGIICNAKWTACDDDWRNAARNFEADFHKVCNGEIIEDCSRANKARADVLGEVLEEVQSFESSIKKANMNQSFFNGLDEAMLMLKQIITRIRGQNG